MRIQDTLRTLTLAGLLVAPAAALAQDADGDGVADAVDAYPCDAALASVSYFPSATGSALIAFEDQWPNFTDLDYNDVVVRAHYRLEQDAAGRVVRLHAVIDPVALGGLLSNGLGLQLPTARVGASARRRVAGGSWADVPLQIDADATMVLSPNLRELFGGAADQINSISGAPFTAGDRLEVEVSFSPAADLSAALGIEAEATADRAGLVARSQLVVTTTPSREPLIEADWLHPGLHITAMGSDQAGKGELAPAVLAAAGRYVADRAAQCETLGELAHARAAGLMPGPILELGQVVTGQAPGRQAEDEVTICDLTGTGAQDTAIASHVATLLSGSAAGTVIRA